MFRLLPLGIQAKFFGAIAFVIALLVATYNWITDSTWDKSFGISDLSTVTLGTVLLAWALGHWRVINFAWVRCPKLAAIFPNLNGKYDVINHSNWPRVSSRSSSGDDSRKPKDLLGSIAGKAVIEMGAWKVRVRYSRSTTAQSVTKYSTSYSESLGKHDDGQPWLSYMYRADVSDPNPETDSDNHRGAAHLTVYPDNGRFVLRGHYWTNRAWAKGLNTAGEIEFRPVTAD